MPRAELGSDLEQAQFDGYWSRYITKSKA